MPERKCETCEFYKDGNCKRYPPSVIYVLESDGYGGMRGQSIPELPWVDVNDWCGEWRAP